MKMQVEAGGEVMPDDHIKNGVTQCSRNVWVRGTCQLIICRPGLRLVPTCKYHYQCLF